MTNKLNDSYVVKWNSDVFGDFKTQSIFDYNLRGPLTHRFKTICNMIIDHIAVKGNISEVEEMAVDDGVIITERLPNSVIIKLHWVWIEKTNK